MAKFLGFLFFTVMFLIGFWAILYMASFVLPFWIAGWLGMKAKERKGSLHLEKRPTLPEQEGVTLLYSKN
ncbi:MAG: hypothetical protein WDA08_09245 [Weeksellaceae bacterium]